MKSIAREKWAGFSEGLASMSEEVEGIQVNVKVLSLGD